MSELILSDQQKRFSGESPDKFILDNFQPKKVLGVSWDTLRDKSVFTFKEIIDYALTLPKTKRSLLSVGAKCFDPLKILCPITTFSKILFQEICSNNFEWDSLLPVDILTKWELWMSKLALLLEIRILLYLFSNILPSTKIELHGFCDSSTQSYVCYIRVFDSSSQRYKCRIVAAKLKVAPVKQLTIPRLELSGCLLLSKLLFNIFSALTKCHLIT